MSKLIIHTNRIDRLSDFFAGNLNVVIALQINPELRTVAEVTAQPDRGINGDAARTFHNFINASRRHMDFLRQPVLRYSVFFNKFCQVFARVYWSYFGHKFLLVIINYFNVVCVPFMPHKTNAPLNVDTNAVLSFSITRQQLKAVRRWDFQVFNALSSVNSVESHFGALGDFTREFFTKMAFVCLLCFFVFEALNHVLVITHNDINVKCYYELFA